jgi:hypothetical protein
VLAAGAEGMRALLDAAPDALAYAWSRRRDRYLQAPALADKRAILEEFLRLVVSSAAYGAIDTLRRGLVVGQIGELVGLPPAEVGEHMRRLARQLRRASAAGPAAEPSPDSGDRAERWMLGVLLNEPALFASLPQGLTPGLFCNPALKAVAEHVWRLAAEDRLEVAALLGTPEAQQWGRLVTDLQIGAERLGDYERTLTAAVEDILRRHRQFQLAERKAREGLGSPDLMRRISEEGRKPDRRRRPRIS